MATISGTMGVQDGRVCVGEGTRHDIGCPTYAPYVSATSGNFGLFTSNPKNHFQLGTGIGLVWGSTDIIQFNQYWDNTDARYESLGAGYSGMVSFNTVSGTLRFGVSPNTTTAADQPTNISPWMLSLTPSNTIGMFTSFPSTTLDVRGTVRIANGGEACDGDRAGAIRYVGGSFQVCYGTGGWAGLADTSGSAVVADRIVSGTSSAVIGPDGTVTTRGLLNIVTGTYVVGVGQGAAEASSGTRITAVGYVAAQHNSGDIVTALGGYAGYNNSGNNLTALGYVAGQYNTGNDSTLLGYYAGRNNSGVSVTALGYKAGISNTFSNATLLGSGVYTADKANQVVLGNGSVAEVSTSGVYVGSGLRTTGNAVVSGTLQISGQAADSCGPGKYGTMKIVGGRIWMCRED